MAKDDKQKDSRVKYMVISVIIAIIIWALVSYSTGPSISKIFHNLPVNYNGTGELNKNGLVLMRSPLPDLSVKISGKRTDLITALDNVLIDVDLSDITEAGTYELVGTVRLPSSKLSVEKVNFASVPVRIENIRENTIPLNIRIGNYDKKLIRSEPEFSEVILSGAESELSQVSYAYVDVLFNGAPEDGEMTLPIRFADSKGNDIRLPETVRCRTTHVKVTNTVYDAVTLPVELDTSRITSQGYHFEHSSIKIEPERVTVGVLPDHTINHVTALVETAESGKPVKCRLQEAEGLYIPESAGYVSATLDLYTSTE